MEVQGKYLYCVLGTLLYIYIKIDGNLILLK
jgi:hypothetical protein